MKKSLLHHLANEFSRTNNVIAFRNSEDARERIETLCREYLPSGSGFDSGSQFDFDKSKRNRLVFNTAFHHMDESGGYCGWTNHNVTVTPDLVFGFTVTVSGRNRNDIKDYIAEYFHSALSRELLAHWNATEKTMRYFEVMPTE